MEQPITFVVAIGACFMLSYMFSKKMSYKYEEQKKTQRENEENFEKYHVLTGSLFDEIEDDKLLDVIKFRMVVKEDKLYEGEEITKTLKDVLSPSELLIQTIFQVRDSMVGMNGSVHSFFITEPFCDYRSFAIEAFNAIGYDEIVVVMQKAEKLAIMIENDEEIDDTEFSDYNFADFTDELKKLFQEPKFALKMNEFIRNHKEDFIDMEEK